MGGGFEISGCGGDGSHESLRGRGIVKGVTLHVFIIPVGS